MINTPGICVIIPTYNQPVICDGYGDCLRVNKYDKLIELDVQDSTYGLKLQMQVMAANLKMKATNAPISYRTKGIVLATYNIITTIIKHM